MVSCTGKVTRTAFPIMFFWLARMIQCGMKIKELYSKAQLSINLSKMPRLVDSLCQPIVSPAFSTWNNLKLLEPFTAT